MAGERLTDKRKGENMIPKVKTWQVKFWTTLDSGRKEIITVRVQTITKRFARMIANEQLGYPAINSTKITVGLINENIPRGPRGIYKKSWLGPIKKVDAPFNVVNTTLGRSNHGTCPGCVNCGRGTSNR